MSRDNLAYRFQVQRTKPWRAIGRVASRVASQRRQGRFEHGGQILAEWLQLSQSGGNVGKELFFQRERLAGVAPRASLEMLDGLSMGLADEVQRDRFLRGKIVEQRSDRDFRRPGNVAGRGRIESLFVEEPLGLFEDSLPRGC